MGSTRSLFHDVTGQSHATGLLEAALAKDRASHAYLFHGPSGAGKRKAAEAFAAALTCDDGGCGTCASCMKASRRTHPDISMIEPVGYFITVDQVREINNSIYLHPSESHARVYIITDAEAFNAESANAFLKTLEEPPEYAYFLLLSQGRDQVLPTILSRCQPVRFGPVPTADIEGALIDSGDVSKTMAQTYARISGGDLELARQLSGNEALAERRKVYIDMGRSLSRGEAEARAMTETILDIATRSGEEAGAEQPGTPEGFETTSSRQLKQDAHRRSRAARVRELDSALDTLATWFRDMLVVASGAPEAVINRDYELELERESHSSRALSYRQAVEAVNATRAKLGYNVDLELALMALFHRLQEVL